MRGLKRTTGILSAILVTIICIANATADNEYMVEKGDSLSRIGELLGVPWEEIMKANNLKNTVIHPKQILIIPSAGKAYNNETPTKSENLVKIPPQNFIPPPSFIQPEVQSIQVQDNQEAAPVSHNPVPQREFASYSRGSYIPPIQGNTLSRNHVPSEHGKAPVTYMVKNGDTVWSISRDFGLTLSELQKANNMATAKIYPGQVLAIPKKVVVAAN